MTALLLAFAGERFVAHFHLLHFSYASLWVGGGLFLSYLLLSQKYELPLHGIFLALVFVIFYKSLTLKNKFVTVNPIDEIKNELTATAALIEIWAIDSGHLPDTLAAVAKRWPSLDLHALTYCSQNCSQIFPELKRQPQRRFWLCHDKNSRDKACVDWYIDDSFTLHKVTQKESL